jgi:hypothetical protein
MSKLRKVEELPAAESSQLLDGSVEPLDLLDEDTDDL